MKNKKVYSLIQITNNPKFTKFPTKETPFCNEISFFNYGVFRSKDRALKEQYKSVEKLLRKNKDYDIDDLDINFNSGDVIYTIISKNIQDFYIKIIINEIELT